MRPNASLFFFTTLSQWLIGLHSRPSCQLTTMISGRSKNPCQVSVVHLVDYLSRGTPTSTRWASASRVAQASGSLPANTWPGVQLAHTTIVSPRRSPLLIPSWSRQRTTSSMKSTWPWIVASTNPTRQNGGRIVLTICTNECWWPDTESTPAL